MNYFLYSNLMKDEILREKIKETGEVKLPPIHANERVPISNFTNIEGSIDVHKIIDNISPKNSIDLLRKLKRSYLPVRVSKENTIYELRNLIRDILYDKYNGVHNILTLKDNILLKADKIDTVQYNVDNFYYNELISFKISKDITYGELLSTLYINKDYNKTLTILLELHNNPYLLYKIYKMAHIGHDAINSFRNKSIFGEYNFTTDMVMPKYNRHIFSYDREYRMWIGSIQHAMKDESIINNRFMMKYSIVIPMIRKEFLKITF